MYKDQSRIAVCYCLYNISKSNDLMEYFGEIGMNYSRGWVFPCIPVCVQLNIRIERFFSNAGTFDYVRKVHVSRKMRIDYRIQSYRERHYKKKKLRIANLVRDSEKNIIKCAKLYKLFICIHSEPAIRRNLLET